MENIIGNSEAKEIMLEILRDFDFFCRENQLKYYLAYGTLLGAVRHNGYIPWDNDIDVWMPRPDYIKFRELSRYKQIKPNLKILDYRYEDSFPFIKITDSRTSLKEKYFVTEKNVGLYIDVFPLDIINDDSRLINKVFNRNYLYLRVFAGCTIRFNTGRTIVKRIIKCLIYPFFRLISKRKICHKIDDVYTSYQIDRNKPLVYANFVWGGKNPFINTYPIEWFNEVIEVDFEGFRFIAPKCYDKILTKRYGDYMTIPPVEEQISHFYEVKWKH